MAPPPLTRRRLNRAALARQLLLERTRCGAVEATAAVAGLNGQRRDDPYVALWSRLERFDREELTRAQRERRVVKATLVRGTLHLVTADQYPALIAALRPMVRRLWQRYLLGLPDVPDIDEITERAPAFAAEPRSAEELCGLLEGLGAAPQLDVADLWWRVRTHGEFLHAPPSGEWRYQGRPSFVAARAWLGPTATGVDRAEGTASVLRRYLAAYGPATAADFARWSGLGVSALRPARDRLGEEVVTYRHESGAALLDLAGAPLPPQDHPAPPRLLPMYDTVLLGHADRSRVLARRHVPAVVRTGGRVQQTILVDGEVAGLWRVAEERGRRILVIAPFARLPTVARREPEAEAEGMLRFLGGGEAGGEVEVERPPE